MGFVVPCYLSPFITGHAYEHWFRTVARRSFWVFCCVGLPVVLCEQVVLNGVCILACMCCACCDGMYVCARVCVYECMYVYTCAGIGMYA